MTPNPYATLSPTDQRELLRIGARGGRDLVIEPPRKRSKVAPQQPTLPSLAPEQAGLFGEDDADKGIPY